MVMGYGSDPKEAHIARTRAADVLVDSIKQAVGICRTRTENRGFQAMIESGIIRFSDGCSIEVEKNLGMGDVDGFYIHTAAMRVLASLPASSLARLRGALVFIPGGYICMGDVAHYTTPCQAPLSCDDKLAYADLQDEGWTPVARRGRHHE